MSSYVLHLVSLSESPHTNTITRLAPETSTVEEGGKTWIRSLERLTEVPSLFPNKKKPDREPPIPTGLQFFHRVSPSPPNHEAVLLSGPCSVLIHRNRVKEKSACLNGRHTPLRVGDIFLHWWSHPHSPLLPQDLKAGPVHRFTRMFLRVHDSPSPATREGR